MSADGGGDGNGESDGVVSDGEDGEGDGDDGVSECWW